MRPATEAMLYRLLRPLVAHLMRRGWGYIAMRDLLKRIYVDEALHGLEGGERPTDSQVSAITGINRREVKRLREAASNPESSEARDPMAGVNATARVVGTWVSSALFRTADGAPRVLPLRAEQAPASFEELLRTAKVDVRAKTVLEELEKAGVLERLPDNRVRLLRAAFTPGDLRDKLLFLAANVGDHLRSAFHNLESGGPVFIERALFHNGIVAGRLDAARPALSDMADRLLRQCNEVLLEGNLARTDTSGPPAREGRLRRLRLGVYYYETDADDRP
ncbi:DUF6502 family protein [Acidocella sp.]|uniref:DUF6502 family protein n=1 Tax=Acidocella sp. TaxID=50710 RepID=UPI002639238D|nr:DUF6502 family protein [Acidocella sp.]